MPKVLVADDDPSILVLVAETLGGSCQVISTYDGEEALRKAEVEQPDVILLDVSMPKLDGIETCRALRVSPNGRDVPIIMVAGATDPEVLVRAFEAGANDYMVKPFSPARLRAKTHTWLLRAGRRSG